MQWNGVSIQKKKKLKYTHNNLRKLTMLVVRMECARKTGKW